MSLRLPVPSTLRRTLAAGLALLGALLAGCATSGSAPSEAAAEPPPDAPLVLERYTPFRLGIGDVIQINFFYTPELNQLQTIMPDGTISMPLIHSVRAAGMTVEELRQDLVTRYRDGQLTNPEIQVAVQELQSNRVFIGGEVGQQGAVALAGQTTVSRAIMLAQGFLTTAYTHQVLVIRRGADGQPTVNEVDVDAILTKGQLDRDILLAAQDIVFVPRSPIANANLFVQQYIKDLLPFGMSVNYNVGNYNLNDN